MKYPRRQPIVDRRSAAFKAIRAGSRLLVIVAVAAAALTTDIRAAAAGWPSYHGQAVHTMNGVLVDFGNGNKAGGLSIRLKNGRSQSFATALGTTWNHRAMTCSSMPQPSRGITCSDWPASIVPSRTLVVVTYWNDMNTGPGIPGPELVVKDVSVAR